MATVINFVVDQGSDFEGVTTVKNGDGSIFDLTGMTPYSEMRRSYYTTQGHTLDVSVHGDPINGQIKIVLSSTLTNSIKSGRYVYDVEVHDGSNMVKRVLEGVITVSPNATRV